jgi:hypothetical protein
VALFRVRFGVAHEEHSFHGGIPAAV